MQMKALKCYILIAGAVALLICSCLPLLTREWTYLDNGCYKERRHVVAIE
jgi:hypothetical protein